MKKLCLIFALLACLSGLAQNSSGFKYQAIIRDAAGNVNANANVNMEISILQGTADGTMVFTETHNVTSNTFGLLNLTIGSVNPSDFNLIDWANGPYFIRISIDGVEFGTSQLLSVPYALHAKTTEKATLAETAENYTETDPLFTTSSASTITQTQIEEWTNKLSGFAETDPSFNSSLAASITQSDLENWNNKLNEFVETDPEFAASLAKGISATDTSYWNSKLDNFVESDPSFMAHPSAGITSDDITKWKALWIWYTTNYYGYQKAADDGDVDDTNELQALSISNDTISLSNDGFVKLPSETDPFFINSAAKGINSTDTSYIRELQTYLKVGERIDIGKEANTGASTPDDINGNIIAIGSYSRSHSVGTNEAGIAIGPKTTARYPRPGDPSSGESIHTLSSIAIGGKADGDYGGIAIGHDADGQYYNIAIGANASTYSGYNRIAIGNDLVNRINGSVVLRGTLFLDNCPETTLSNGQTGRIFYRDVAPDLEANPSGSASGWTAKAFMIDHPLDPENKVLRHYCMEGPQVWNVYAGNIQIKNGKASVQLPHYYSKLNKVGSEIYSLTVIGGFADCCVLVASNGSEFEIAATEDIQISWTVKVLRNDELLIKDLKKRPVEQFKNKLKSGQIPYENKSINTRADTTTHVREN